MQERWIQRGAIVVGLVVLGALAARPAAAARLYVAGQGGWNFVLDNDFIEDDAVYGGALGVDFDGLAVELTLNYSKTEGDGCTALDEGGGTGGQVRFCRGVQDALDLDTELEIVSIGGALRGNIELGDAFRLYLLAGLEGHFGKYRVGTAFGDDEQDVEEFGFVGGGGLEVFLSDNFAIGPDIRYHLLFTDNFDSPSDFEDTIRNDQFDTVPQFLTVMGRLSIYF